MKKKILIIEDNTDLSHILRVNIEALGFDTDLAVSGDEGLEKALSNGPDLIVLDLMLPGMPGLEILKRLRNGGSKVPVLVLTSKSSEMDRVIGLELGADDYVTKPFSVMELQARIKAILRRTGKVEPETPPHRIRMVFGDLTIIPENRQVQIKDKPVDLTAKEFDLLQHFANRPGQVLNRSQLLDAVWGYGHSGYEHTVNSHINRLRSKIEQNPDTPAFILTVWGVGYKFTDAYQE